MAADGFANRGLDGLSEDVADPLGVLTQDVGVDAQRYARIGMAEAGCHDMDRDSGQQQGCGVQVTKIVKPGVRQGLRLRDDHQAGQSPAPRNR